MKQSLMKMDEATMTKMNILFGSVSYLVKNETLGNFPKLLELQNLNGLDTGHTYMNDKAASNFVYHISGYYLDRLKLTIAETDFFGVYYSDGSTDITESELRVRRK